jgi:hypothetical protein
MSVCVTAAGTPPQRLADDLPPGYVSPLLRVLAGRMPTEHEEALLRRDFSCVRAAAENSGHRIAWGGDDVLDEKGAAVTASGDLMLRCARGRPADNHHIPLARLAEYSTTDGQNTVTVKVLRFHAVALDGNEKENPMSQEEKCGHRRNGDENEEIHVFPVFLIVCGNGLDSSAPAGLFGKRKNSRVAWITCTGAGE